jgi:hypothetical protein
MSGIIEDNNMPMDIICPCSPVFSGAARQAICSIARQLQSLSEPVDSFCVLLLSKQLKSRVNGLLAALGPEEQGGGQRICTL